MKLVIGFLFGGFIVLVFKNGEIASANARMKADTLVCADLATECSEAIETQKSKDWEIHGLKRTLSILLDDFNELIEDRRRLSEECGQ